MADVAYAGHNRSYPPGRDLEVQGVSDRGGVFDDGSEETGCIGTARFEYAGRVDDLSGLQYITMHQ